MPLSGAVTLEEAAQRILEGGAVAFPTETVFGLGACATNASAVERVYEIKRRPRDKPMPIIASDLEMVRSLTDALTGRALRLAETFWPGPLTIVCESNGVIPSVTTAGGSTIAIRVPGLGSLRELISQCGEPLIAPSANRSGERPARSCEDAAASFEPEIRSGAVVCYCPEDADAGIGSPSTILIPGASAESDRVLREGPISAEDMARVP